ncbi:hypothetical protein UA08_01283 [Talaromyces atroroseus]|uniref:Uncharacterized protein n=1 Tax=Talaromyces atroroseus TaxID=1441469 RepID=A0A1Q5QC68_TALAT|nr:hypothetical protein UA08_01283 [Talaromyces atroroseus]OKL63359.1 hypothetical protein UA08_01283 [Talaromyces atroroseus]
MSQVTYDVYRGSQNRWPVLHTITRTIQPSEVFVKITHSGICSTDMHCIQDEIALGHEGRDQYCPHVELYGWHAHDTGSFATGTVCDQTSLEHIPKDIDSADAAPLMCAGATVWEILSKPSISHGDRVGVLGIGGLGHLAVKIGAQMGYHVVVLSSSEAKRDEAMKFGAKEFHVLHRGEPVSEEIAPLNHLLLCTSGRVNYDQ